MRAMARGLFERDARPGTAPSRASALLQEQGAVLPIRFEMCKPHVGAHRVRAARGALPIAGCGHGIQLRLTDRRVAASSTDQ